MDASFFAAATSPLKQAQRLASSQWPWPWPVMNRLERARAWNSTCKHRSIIGGTDHDPTRFRGWSAHDGPCGGAGRARSAHIGRRSGAQGSRWRVSPVRPWRATMDWAISKRSVCWRVYISIWAWSPSGRDRRLGVICSLGWRPTCPTTAGLFWNMWHRSRRAEPV